MADNEPIRPLFQDQRGDAIGFFLHESIRNTFQRDNLIKYITDHGGKVLDQPRGADTVLVDEKRSTASIADLQIVYTLNRDQAFHGITVEPMKFVQSCIRQNRFIHIVKQRKAMGGYIGGRTAFTKADDDNLCWYLSRRIPNPEDGGRNSLGVYKELCAAARIDDTLAWGKRHTDESWKQRYKINKRRLDPIIEKYAEKIPPRPPAWYGLSRRYNRNPKNAYKFADPDEDVIDITDDSAFEFEESDMDVKSRRPIPSSDGIRRSPKRCRIKGPDSSSPIVITPAHKAARLPPSSPIHSLKKSGKGRDADNDTSGRHDHRDHFNFSPAHEQYEPAPFEDNQLLRSPVTSAPRRDEHLTPAPSPTLVHRRSSAIRSPQPPVTTQPPTRRVNLGNTSSSHPSTSFRNVVHSSPVLTGSVSPKRRVIQSHNTSATEPSSRSMIVPQELSHSTTNANNVPAEASITRESSHMRSSPITQPMKKTSRRFPSQQSSAQISPDESENEEQSQKTPWAPFRNTRSRIKSVEPAPLLGTKRKRKVKGRLLEPVHEGEIEHDQELRPAGLGLTKNRVILSVTTETMREEQNVADLLIPHADETTSGTLSGTSNRVDGKDEGNGEEDDTEDETQGVRRFVGRREEEEEEEEEEEDGVGAGVAEGEDDSEVEGRTEETIEFETTTAAAATVESGVEQAVGGPEDISSDDETTRQQFLSRAPAARKTASQHQQQFSSASEDEDDDDDISQIFTSPITTHDTPLKTAEEVLAAFADSPEVGASDKRRHHQGNLFGSYQSGSLRSRDIQTDGAPRQLVLGRQSAQATPAGARVSLPTSHTSGGVGFVDQRQKRTGPHRVSFGDPESSPSSVGSLPLAPLEVNIQSIGGSGSPRVLPVPRSSATRPQTQQPRGRSGSIQSTSSELQSTFPTPGTRAHAEKKRMERELKQSPYTPPVGTMAAQVVAAQVAAARRVLRPRNPPK